MPRVAQVVNIISVICKNWLLAYWWQLIQITNSNDTNIPANSLEFVVAKISFSIWCMLSSIRFDTIEISSIIKTLSSASDIRSCVLFWSDNAGSLSPASLGIPRPVLIVVPSMFTAATPVGAIIRTVGISGFDGPCLNVLTKV